LRLPCNGLLKGGWDFTAKSLDHHIAWAIGRGSVGPWQYLYMMRTVWRHPGQGAGIVHPQAHLAAALRQIGRQPPAYADVAKVVDHLAKDIPDGAVGRMGFMHQEGDDSAVSADTGIAAVLGDNVGQP